MTDVAVSVRSLTLGVMARLWARTFHLSNRGPGPGLLDIDGCWAGVGARSCLATGLDEKAVDEDLEHRTD